MAARVQKVTRRHHGVHESVRHRFFASCGREVINDRNSLSSAQTIFSGEEVAADDFDPNIATDLVGVFCELRGIATRAHEAAQIPEAVTQQAFNDARADEAIGAGDENGLNRADDAVLKCG